MGSLLVSWVLSTVALLAVAFLAPGFRISSVESALIVALVVGLVSSILGLLLRLAAGPASLALYAALLVLMDAFVFRVTALVVPGFAMLGLFPAFVGAILLSVLHVVLHHAAGGAVVEGCGLARFHPRGSGASSFSRRGNSAIETPLSRATTKTTPMAIR